MIAPAIHVLFGSPTQPFYIQSPVWIVNINLYAKVSVQDPGTFTLKLIGKNRKIVLMTDKYRVYYALSQKNNRCTNKNRVKDLSINTCQDSSVGKAWDCKHNLAFSKWIDFCPIGWIRRIGQNHPCMR